MTGGPEPIKGGCRKNALYGGGGGVKAVRETEQPRLYRRPPDGDGLERQ